MVVDDSATSRIKLTAAIQALGHQVVSADGGAQGLEVLRAQDIDLVLLDIVMPEMDGYDVLRVMGADALLAQIPVLVISSLDDMKEIVTAIELGAVDFLPKNVDPLLLKARVSACLEKKRLRDLELEYLRDVDLLTDAARIVNETDFNPARLPLEKVNERSDPLGDLGRVFTQMAGEVHRREMAYRRQIDLLRGGMLLILMGVITGLYPALSKILTGTSIDNPLGMAAWVSSITMLLGLAMCLVRGNIPKLTWKKLRFALIIGPFAGAIPQLALFASSEHISGIELSIILAMESMIVFLFTTALRLEKPTILRFLGLGLGLVAVALVLRPVGDQAAVWAPIWLMVALLVPISAGVEGILMVAVPSEETDPWELVFLTMLGSSGFAWIAAVGMGATLGVSAMDQTTMTVIVLFAALSAGATWLLAVAVRKTGAVFASQSGYVATIMGVIWSILLLSETGSMWIWAALVCMIGGMILVRPKESDEIVKPEQVKRDVPAGIVKPG
ncbi:response regulator [Jannaschia sp. AI_61]|uniref:response regulator n=1 Tax=Jannaschia sp. AI_61 TaxID=2829796 RepID=UPI002106ACDB|nr:response regulator [Jannaschia sp. AI_61]